jgi:hypothetical protein
MRPGIRELPRPSNVHQESLRILVCNAQNATSAAEWRDDSHRMAHRCKCIDRRLSVRTRGKAFRVVLSA